MKEKFSTSKLLFFMLCLTFVSLSVGVIADQFSNDAWLHWIERGFTVAVFCCWFPLGRKNRFYRLTSVFKVAALILTLAGWLMSVNYIIYVFYKYLGMSAEDMMPIHSVLYWMRVAAALPAVILEYVSHGKNAPAVRKSWIVLLAVYLAWLVVGNIIGQISAAQFEAQIWSWDVLDMVNEGMALINLVFRLFYLWLLFRTVKCVKAEETE